jgi:nitroreductase/dihydropteridine reductase
MTQSATLAAPTQKMPSDALIERLQWRYAAKKMDPAKAVPQNKVERILEAARLAPTSSGLQPYEIIVVSSKPVRERIKPIAWNQGQITDCSQLLVFAAWDNYTAERINMMFDLTNAVRGTKNEGWENYRNMLLGMYPQRDAEVNFQHAARQAYIGLSAAMMAAAFEEVDCTPMEGFDLRERGLRSVAILPLGYREADKDWLVNLVKVRRPREQFITEV